MHSQGSGIFGRIGFTANKHTTMIPTRGRSVPKARMQVHVDQIYQTSAVRWFCSLRYSGNIYVPPLVDQTIKVIISQELNFPQKSHVGRRERL